MNKTWLFTTLTLALIAAAPAHAISAKYREQLERSGCTQMTDGTTCDIHKSKAENAAAAQHASSGFDPWVGTWYVYTEYGNKIDEIVVTAKTVKTRGHLVEDAKASQGKLTFRVQNSAFTLNDAFKRRLEKRQPARHVAKSIVIASPLPAGGGGKPGALRLKIQ